MKVRKITVLSVILINAFIFSAEQDQSLLDLLQQTTTTTTSTTTTEKPAEQSSSTTSDSTSSTTQQTATVDVTAWNNHLKALLEKGAFWDNDKHIPTTEWQDKAVEEAKTILTKDKSRADELKNAFKETVNKKFLEIEKGTDEAQVGAVIKDFNDKIDAFVSGTSTKTEEEKKAEETAATTTTTTTTDTAVETPPVEEPKELTPEEKAEQEKQKKEESVKELWKECLDNIKYEGLTVQEIPDIVKDVEFAAGKLIDTFPQQINAFKGELLDALAIRKNQPLAQFDDTITKHMLTLFGAAAPEEEPQESLSESVNEPQQLQQQQQPVRQSLNGGELTKTTTTTTKTEKITTQQPIKQSSTGTTIIEDQTTHTQETYGSSTRTTIKQIKEDKKTTIQSNFMKRALALKLETDKAAEEKKGIITSFSEYLWGKPEKEATEAQKELREEQEQDLNRMLTSKIDPNTGTLLTLDNKDLIKTAYDAFQDLLLRFTESDYWDAPHNRPNQKWIDALKKPLKILIEFEIITPQDATQLIKEILKTNKKISIEDGQEIKAIIKAYTHNVENAAVLERKKMQYQKEKEEMNKLKQAQRQARQEERNTQQEKLENAIQIDQNEINHMTIHAEFVQLQRDWRSLMATIKNSMHSTNQQNKEWMEDALSITKNMINCLPIVEANNHKAIDQKRKEITNKHASDFSAALSHNGEYKGNIHPYIHEFNRMVHTL